MEDATVRMTESAARRVQTLAEAEGNPALMLRLAVSGGGCSGFQYGFSLEAMTTAADQIFEDHGARLIVDDASLDLLKGAEVDYVNDLMGSMFTVRNPNATATCGCRSSFSA
ncbi:MAG: iron-sulfur cluster insertion protein [Rhodospirillaceae bacterium]|nr:MAG: iron-sulfur cluster insertion protein [Rhodospirillaceae bacterium]